jgi:hypothetical protein
MGITSGTHLAQETQSPSREKVRVGAMFLNVRLNLPWAPRGARVGIPGLRTGISPWWIQEWMHEAGGISGVHGLRSMG